MKKISTLVIIAISMLLFSCNEKVKKETEEILEKSTNKIEVLDFHSTHRCMTCNAIEANTRYTLDTYFSNELEKATIVLKIVNVDEDENFKTAEKFQATGTSLFLNVTVNGKETQINLTDFAFLNGNDKKSFSKELKTIIEAELTKI